MLVGDLSERSYFNLFDNYAIDVHVRRPPDVSLSLLVIQPLQQPSTHQTYAVISDSTTYPSLNDVGSSHFGAPTQDSFDKRPSRI